MSLPLASIALFSIAAVSAFLNGVALYSLFRVVRRMPRREPARFPRISIIKPLCGMDDELRENLESHLRVDYPGEWEIVLGLRSENDAAWPLACEFAELHKDRVRVVLQQGEPGHNPKVNQLITLTRAARFEVIAMTDSNIRVPPVYLREVAGALEDPQVGLATHLFGGAGEKRIGAVLDNLTISSFVCPTLAAASVLLRHEQIVGKSVAMRREVLERLGGWHLVKDVLAEDQRLGVAIRQHDLHAVFCPTPVTNIQIHQPFSAYWGRHTRWAMIRYRVLVPGVFFEPFLNPTLFALAGLIVSESGWPLALGLTALTFAFQMAAAQFGGKMTRGYGFKLQHLLLVPLRDMLSLAMWARGATLRTVNWRGNRLRVLAETRLANAETIARARNIQRLGR